MEPQDLITCWARYVRPKLDNYNQYPFTCQKCRREGLSNSMVHITKHCVNNPFRRHFPLELEEAIAGNPPPQTVDSINNFLCEVCFREYYDVLEDQGETKPFLCYIPECIRVVCVLKPRRGHNTKSARKN